MKGLQTILYFFTSPLRGEVCFRLEQKYAKVRKQGEGAYNINNLFHPHPEFLALLTRAEIHPSPLKGEGVLLYLKILDKK